MREQHHPNPNIYRNLILQQNQHGGSALPGFRGVGIQRGYGLGSMFRSLFRSAIPLLKSGAKTLGKAAVSTGMGVAKDVLAGKDIRSAATTRARQTGNELKGQAVNALSVNAMTPQSGGGIRRRAPSKASQSPSKKGRKTQGIKRGHISNSTRGVPAKRAKTSPRQPANKRRIIDTLGIRNLKKLRLVDYLLWN